MMQQLLSLSPSAPLEREPDLVIHFVDRLNPSPPVRYLGLDDVAYTDDEFFIMHGMYERRRSTQIAFEEIGRQCVIRTERGRTALPFLIFPILNLIALERGLVPLHGAALTYKGTGIVATGWSKSGKTETLLAFLEQGASYVGDETLFLTSDGRQVIGLPRPINVWEWQLDELQRYAAWIAPAERARLRLVKGLMAGSEWILRRGSGRRWLPDKLEEMYPQLRRRLVSRLPLECFGEAGDQPTRGRADKLFFLTTHDRPDISVTAIGTRDVTDRMVHSHNHNRRYFQSRYMQYRFAFPDAKNDLIDQVEEREREALARALGDTEAYLVAHPYPASMQALFEATAPFCS